MESRSIKVLCPSYYRKFHCIGPSCTDNCCHDWPIEIDKAHYLRYKAEKNSAFMPLCAQHVHRIKKGADDGRYARLSLDDAGRCGFQDADGGCKIIRLLGEDALSTTCALYPRRKAEFTPGQWELSLSMSCEEAVRIGALEPDSVQFQEETMEFPKNAAIFALESVGIGPKGQLAPPPAWGGALRTVCLRLMQSRELTLPERLMAITLLLRRLDKLVQAGQESQVPMETIRFLQTIEQGGMTDFFRQLDYSRGAHLSALRIPLGHLAAGRQGTASRNFLQALQPYLEADNTGAFFAGAKAVEALLERIQNIADPLMAEHSIWIENYFVNYLFSTLFPFFYRRQGLTFEDHGLLLIQQYALLRCLIAAAPAEQSAEKTFTQAIVHTARLSQHGDFAADTQRLAQSLGISGTAHLAYLLR